MVTENVLQWCARCDTFNTLLVFLVVLCIVRVIQMYRKNKSLPPGPWGLPVVGSLGKMQDVPVHVQFAEFADEHGPISSVRLGNQLCVLLSDYRVIKEAFKREEFTARPHTEFYEILGGYGLINAEGALWRRERRFVHEKLRSLGMNRNLMGKKVMVPVITKEVDLLIIRLGATEGEPTDVSTAVGLAVTNVICSILMSVRFKPEDERYQRFNSLIEEGFILFGSLSFVNFIPVFRYLPWLRRVRDKLSQNREEMAGFFQETIDQHKATFNNNEARDLVDTYLQEIMKAKAEGRESELFQGKDHDRQMQQILGDLFSAGMETVKTTIEWTLALMLHNPDELRAVQEELDQVVGRSRNPTLEDSPNLPRLNATICEVFRRTSIVPLGTTHASTCEVMLGGYRIPGGAQVIPLLHKVHMDENLWDEPEKFKPSRFLTPEGKVHKPEYFMPFGVGRRMCLGQELAQMELVMFLANILHNFDLRLPEGAPLPSLKGNAGVTVTPDPFKICLIKRDKSLPVRSAGAK